MLDVTDAKRGGFFYGGLSCSKDCVILGKDIYLLKYPGNLKNKGLKNVTLSYSNSPVCEFIGSHIYSMFGIPTHITRLATCKGKIVVLCKDFTYPNFRLQEFRNIRVCYSEDTDNKHVKGSGSCLSDIFNLLSTDKRLSVVDGLVERLCDMIIIDALIGNFDRNNGNWGVLTDTYSGEIVGIAPVYDNGNCLYDKWDEGKMSRALEDRSSMLTYSYLSITCFFTKSNGKKYNPFKLIESNEFPEITHSLRKLFKFNCLPFIVDFINALDVISDVQKKFYTELITIRYKRLLDML